MTATPADVARFTNDGILITKTNPRVLVRDPSAIDVGTDERELFFDNAADADVVTNELFGLISRIGREHEGLEFEDTLGLGTIVPLWPAAPYATLQDDTRGINARCSARAYTFDMGADRYAVEFVGLGYPAPPPGARPTWDSSTATMDGGDYTFDAS